jgi:REP element-mobilizing transposase RayT
MNVFFGEIINDEMVLNKNGKIVRDEWLRTSEIRHEIVLDEYVVMPNHFHAIILINDCRGDRPVARTNNLQVTRTPKKPVVPDSPNGPKPGSIGAFVAGFKSVISKHVNEIRQTPGVPVWQRNYYEHVIRDEDELKEVRQYILTNPMKWALDRENPEYRG